MTKTTTPARPKKETRIDKELPPLKVEFNVKVHENALFLRMHLGDGTFKKTKFNLSTGTHGALMLSFKAKDGKQMIYQLTVREFSEKILDKVL